MLLIFYKQLSVRMKLFSLYLLLFTLPLLILGTLGYNWMVSTVQRNVDSSFGSTMQVVAEGIDKQFNQMSSFSVQLSVTPWVQRVMHLKDTRVPSDRLTVIQIDDYNQQLRLHNSSNPFIDDILVIFHEKDLLLSSIDKGNYKLFNEYSFVNRSTDSGEWQDIMNTYNDANVLMHMEIETYGKIRKGVVYVQSFPMVSKGDILATLFMFIDINSIEEKLKPLMIDDKAIIIVTDNKNCQITGLNASDETVNKILEAFKGESIPGQSREVNLPDFTYTVFRQISEDT